MGLLGFYFSPSGRISRGWFWVGLLGLFAFEIVFNLWLATAMFGRDLLDPASGNLAKPARQLSLLINLIFLFPIFVVLAKRFHDRNKGAVWTIPFLLAYSALIAAAIMGVIPMDFPVDPAAVHPAGLAVASAWTAVLIWVLIELGVIRGTKGQNRFGNDPLIK